MPSNELILDRRTAADLRREIAALAASYTPEWHFDPADPDAGGVIALIFANQMADNLSRMNLLFDKYHTEFVNLLGVSLLPADPAAGVVVARVIPETVPGVPMPAGTRLLGSDGGGEPIPFETLSDVYLTAASLTDVLAISGRFGRIAALRGGLTSARLLPEETPLLPAAGEESTELPMTFFDFSQPGVERNAVLLGHRSVLDTDAGVDVNLRLRNALDGSSLAQLLADPAHYRWSCYTEQGLSPVEAVQARGDVLVIRQGAGAKRQTVDGADYFLLCLEALEPVCTTLAVSECSLASSCSNAVAEFVSHNNRDLTPERFLPFGETASVFDECCIGHDRIFGQAGATVNLDFQLSFVEKLVSFSPQQEADELKIIKRKPRTVPFETARTCVEQISVSYFNGLGWRRLECASDQSTLFNGQHPGKTRLRFVCPEDWRPITVGGWAGRCLRLSVVRADNCYLQPCLHTMPLVEDLRISYAYEGAWRLPQLLKTVSGTRVEDAMGEINAGKPVTLLRTLPYGDNAMYLGFDKRFEGAPISLFFDVQQSVHFAGAPVSFEYGSLSGWKPLKVIDQTQNLSAAGTVLFMPPSDMTKLEVEGISRYWLRLRDTLGAYDDPGCYHPVIRSVLLNAVPVQNVQTMPEEIYSIPVATPNMSFPIAADNILSADVFVNEKNRLSPAHMRELMQQRPEDVRVSYDFLGEISSFFVRWNEVESFDNSQPTDRHYIIDRMNAAIHFGDGVHVMIPPAGRGAAFTLQARCCQGARGNLPAGAIDSLFGSLLYVDQIRNPIATFAGSNLESVASAHRRGANLLCARGRLVSGTDYIREVAAFSESIEKVKCLAGCDLEGNPAPGQITIAVMTRDWAEGSYAWHSLRQRLHERLLQRSGATVSPQQLVLAEPIYAEISVSVWAQADHATHAFGVQSTIREGLDRFLSPIGQGESAGWEIGVLPSEKQLWLMLRSLRLEGRVTRFLTSVRYIDRQGVHETGLDDLRAGPFVIGVPGEHRIYVDL